MDKVQLPGFLDDSVPDVVAARAEALLAADGDLPGVQQVPKELPASRGVITVQTYVFFIN